MAATIGKEQITFHPCYYEEAHRKYARMHLPVAPTCNIQCRFCNRLFDCTNETRPGVTSKVLGPEEAMAKVSRVISDLSNLSVIGVAGPGEPLANSETMETFRLLRERYPDILLCVATNGLLLPLHVNELGSLGVRYVTVTINAIDSDIGSRIYSHVRHEGETIRGKEAFEKLSRSQWEGLRMSVEKGMIVKVNSVLVPGINEAELPRIAQKAAEAGAFVMNVIPFLSVKGTEFEDRRAPSGLEIRHVREECGRHIRQITHCARCRSDAIGMLDCDLSSWYY